MTQPDEPLSALEMAVNCARTIERSAREADADPVKAQTDRLGERQHQAARLAACLALVSIAEDLHRLVKDASLSGIRVRS